MPTLFLFRHAKAAQPLPGQPDFDRSLTERGRNDAATMGKLLTDQAIELALVSASCRTRETWDIASAEIASPPSVSIERDLYLCSSVRLMARLRQVPNTIKAIIAVGHNPCTQEVAFWLASQAAPRQAEQIRDNFPTAALAIFDLDGADWDRLGPEHVRLRRFVTPRLLS